MGGEGWVGHALHTNRYKISCSGNLYSETDLYTQIPCSYLWRRVVAHLYTQIPCPYNLYRRVVAHFNLISLLYTNKRLYSPQISGDSRDGRNYLVTGNSL